MSAPHNKHHRLVRDAKAADNAGPSRSRALKTAKRVSLFKIPPANPKICSKASFIQLGYGIWVNMISMMTGLAIRFFAVVIPLLPDEHALNEITLTREAWIALILSIGSLLGGVFMDKYGRKQLMVLCLADVALGWFVIGFATQTRVIINGGVIISIGLGMMLTSPGIYVTEITLPNMRGVIGVLPYLFFFIGFSTMTTVATFYKWSDISLICGTYSVLLMISYYLILPESPYFVLVSSPDMAIESLKKFRSNSYDVQTEIDMLLDFQDENDILALCPGTKMLVSRLKINYNKKKLPWLIVNIMRIIRILVMVIELRIRISGRMIGKHSPNRILGRIIRLSLRETIVAAIVPSVCKPFAVSFAYILFMLGSGCIVVPMWTVDMLALSNTELNPDLGNQIICATRIVVGIMTAVIMFKVKRRLMAQISTFGIGCSSICIYIHLKTHSGFQLDPLFLYIAYTTFACLGYYSLPFTMMYELLPLQFRGFLSGLIIAVAILLIFSMHKAYPYVCEEISLANVMAIFGGISLLGAIFICYKLPETYELTLPEIEEYYNSKRPTLVSSRIIQSDQFVSMMKATTSHSKYVQEKGLKTTSMKLETIKSQEKNKNSVSKSKEPLEDNLQDNESDNYSDNGTDSTNQNNRSNKESNTDKDKDKDGSEFKKSDDQNSRNIESNTKKDKEVSDVMKFDGQNSRNIESNTKKDKEVSDVMKFDGQNSRNNKESNTNIDNESSEVKKSDDQNSRNTVESSTNIDKESSKDQKRVKKSDK